MRLQKNTAVACNDQLKELSTSLGHVRLQVRLPCLCCSLSALSSRALPTTCPGKQIVNINVAFMATITVIRS